MTTLTKEPRIEAGSNVEDKYEMPKHVKGSEKVFGANADDPHADLSTSSFTTFWTWRANGVFKAVRFNHPSVNANSRVFVSVSEFNSDARVNRFIGDAKMAVFNVAPFNGGFFAWVEISWSTPLNARFDVLIDP